MIIYTNFNYYITIHHRELSIQFKVEFMHIRIHINTLVKITKYQKTINIFI